MSIKILKFTLIFILLLISIGAASASQVTNNTNSSSLISNHTNIISGNVKKCSDGKPFNGVNVTVRSVSGKLITSTKTNTKGYYYLKFSGDSLSYRVSASYPGHVTSTKTVTVQRSSSKTSIYSGQANFRLGPMPSITITSPSSQLLNQTFNFSLSFNNTGNETGFGPMAQLILPSQIKLNSASFLGSPVTISSPQVFPSSGVLIDPLTGLTVTGTPGYTFYTLQYPLGSFTKGQPSAVININALLLGNSTLGDPLDITAYPVFRFGANAAGTTPLRGNSDTTQVTPTVIKLTKTSNAHEQETVTGRNFPITYTLNVDVAAGKTVKNVVVTDVIPKNLQFIKVTSYDGGTPITIPSTLSPGGTLSINLGNVTGILGTDRTITYQVFAPEFDNSSQPVIDPIIGNTVNGTNYANVTGVYNTTNVSSSANYTVNLKALAVQKNVEDITNPSAPKPTDILKYTVNFQVSDYFSLKNMVINDDLGDGQTFLTDTSHNPTLTLNLPNIGLINLSIDLTDPNEFLMVHDSTTGITHLFFNISQILINNNYSGIVEGGNYTGTDYGATQGFIKFWSKININYENPNKPIVSKDSVNNNVTGNAQLVNSSNNISDSSQSLVTIVSPTASKVIVNVKRNGVDLGPITTILPGDQVTFSLKVNVPTTNLEQFYMVDYLPIPLFLSSQFSTGQQPLSQGDAFPNTGEWKLASDDTLSILSGVNPTLIIDSVQNTMAFYYGNVYNLTQPSSLAHILFTVTATGEPMADGLYLTNLLNINYNNSFNELYSDNQIVSIITGEPQLIINKTASPNSGRQAGDKVTYTITIKNTGHATAYNVVVKDDLLSNSGSYIVGTPTITAVYQNGSSIDLTGLGNLFGSGINFGSLFPIFGTDNANNTIVLTYDVILSSNVYPLQLLNNTVEITNFTALPRLTAVIL